MLRLLVMLILASVHGCITACRATYGLVPKQGQAAKPIAIESASFVAVQISFLQKKKWLSSFAWSAEFKHGWMVWCPL
jgi:hypothetical protein